MTVKDVSVRACKAIETDLEQMEASYDDYKNMVGDYEAKVLLKKRQNLVARMDKCIEKAKDCKLEMMVGIVGEKCIQGSTEKGKKERDNGILIYGTTEASTLLDVEKCDEEFKNLTPRVFLEHFYHVQREVYKVERK